MLSTLQAHDEVAVLPAIGAPASETLEIARVHYVGVALIALADGRTFAREDGVGIGRSPGCVVPATNAHRECIRISRALDRLKAICH
jgi:hypothetical protein